MSRCLTKKEYYANKNIPVLVYCHKLEPQVNIRNHLLDPLPKLATEVKKIYSHPRPENKANLQLGNALKIIHELEDELQLLTNQKIQIQSLYLDHKTQKEELQRTIGRLQGHISDLESTMQKNQFESRKIYEKEADRYNNIILDLQKRIGFLSQENKKVKEKQQKQRRELSRHHESQLGRAEEQARNIRDKSLASMKKLQKNYGKVNSQNTEFRQKIYQLETQNEKQSLNLKKHLNQQILQNKRIKVDLEQRILTLSTELELSKSSNKELQDKNRILESRLKENKQSFQLQEKEWKNINQEMQTTWKQKIQELNQQKQKITHQLIKKSIELSSKFKSISELQNLLDRTNRELDQLRHILANKDKEKESKCEQIRMNFERQLNIRIQELRYNIEHNLHKQHKENMDKLRQQLNGSSSKIIGQQLNQINSLQTKRSELEYENITLQDTIKKTQRKIEQLVKQLEMLTQKLNLNKDNVDLKCMELVQENRQELQKVKSRHSKQIQLIKDQYQKEIDALKKFFNTEKFEYNAKIDELLIHKKQLQNNLGVLKEELEDDRMSYIEQIQSLTKQVQSQNSRKQQLRTHKKQLDELLSKKNGEISLLQNSIQLQKRANKQLCQQLNENCEKNSTLREENFSLMSANSQLIAENQKWKIQIESLRVLLEKEKENYNRKVTSDNQKIKRMQEQINQLSTQKINMRKSLMQKDQSSKQQWEKINAQFSSINSRLTADAYQKENELQTKIKSLTFENSNLIQQLHLLQSNIKDQTNRNREFEMRFQDYQQTIKNLQNQKIKIQNQNTELHERWLSSEIYRKKYEESEVINKNLQKTKQKNKLQKDKLEFQVDRMKTERNRAELSLKNANNKIQNLEKQRQKLVEKVRSFEKEIQDKHQERIEQNNKLREQLKQVINILEEQKSKLSQELTSREKQIKQVEFGFQLKIQELNQRNNKQLINLKNIIDSLTKQNNSLRIDINSKDNEIQNLRRNQEIQFESTQKYHQKLSKTVSEYEKKLQQLHQKLTSNQKVFESQRNKNALLKSQLQEMRNLHAQTKIDNEKLYNEISKLREVIIRNQEDIEKIYQENDQRVDECRKELTENYQKEINKKQTMIKILEGAKVKLEEQARKASQRFDEEFVKQQKNFIHKLSEKNDRISQLTIENQTITQQYEINWQDLQSLKAKWSKIFNDLDNFGGDLNRTPSQYKTEEKKITKVVKQATQQSTKQRIITHHFKNNENRMFTREPPRQPAFNQEKKQKIQKNITSLLRDSDSDVICSRIINHSCQQQQSIRDSSNSLAYECSSETKHDVKK